MAKLEVVRSSEEIGTVPELLEHVRRARDKSPTGAVWLRGLADDRYRLVPSIGREHRFGGKAMTFDAEIERLFLRRFRRHSFAFFGKTLTEWEALFVARHHGLPVRLLDWTSNPLAALFFACEYASVTPPPDARIWFLIPSGNLECYLDVLGNDSHPFDVRGIKVVYPMAVAARVNAQSGLFTIQQNAWIPLDETDVSALEPSDVDVLSLTEFRVPSGSRARLLKELNDLQVTRRTLFPDLDGLSVGLITAEILRGSVTA